MTFGLKTLALLVGLVGLVGSLAFSPLPPLRPRGVLPSSWRSRQIPSQELRLIRELVLAAGYLSYHREDNMEVFFDPQDSVVVLMTQTKGVLELQVEPLGD